MPAPRQRREIMNWTATVTVTVTVTVTMIVTVTETVTVTVTNPYGTRRAIRLLRLVRQCGR